MTDPQPASLSSFGPALAALWQRHRDTSYERIALVESVAAAALHGTLDGQSQLRGEGERAAHKLAGSLGTFGIAAGSAAAFEIEGLLRDETPDPRRLADAALALREAVESAEIVESPSPDQEAKE